MNNYFEKKHDKGKDPWDLLDLTIIKTIVRILKYGFRKYGTRDSWKDVEDAERRYYAAMMRHISAWKSGSDLDPESKLPHLWHAFCNLYFLIWFYNKGKKS